MRQKENTLSRKHYAFGKRKREIFFRPEGAAEKFLKMSFYGEKNRLSFLHLGENVRVLQNDVIAIINIDDRKNTSITKDFLKKSEKEGRSILTGFEIPRSVVVCDDGEGGARTVYSHISSKGLAGRAAAENKEFTQFNYKKDR